MADFPSKDSMQSAYVRLRRNGLLSSEEEQVAKTEVLSGCNSAWAWLALTNIKNWTESQKTTLCQIIASGGDGHIVIWALDEDNLTQQQRYILKNRIITLKNSGFAYEGLTKVQDWDENQRSRLERIAVGDLLAS